jgi:hypothetical protein
LTARPAAKILKHSLEGRGARRGKLLTITDQDALQMKVVLEAIRDLAAGRKRLEDLP